MVRGDQLHRFLAWLLHVNRLLMSPKLGGERHLEVLEAFGPDGPGSCTPCVFPLPLEG